MYKCDCIGEQKQKKKKKRSFAQQHSGIYTNIWIGIILGSDRPLSYVQISEHATICTIEKKGEFELIVYNDN